MSKLRYSDFYRQLDIDELEDAIGFDPIESANQEDRGYCPLPWGMHSNGDTTGKFSINRDKFVYNCWVCGGGSLLDLAMAMQDLDPHEATTWLAKFATGEETQEDFQDRIAEIFSNTRDEPPMVPYFNERVLEQWIHNPHPFIYDKWGIDEETRLAYSVGYSETQRKYDPKDPQEFYEGPAIVFPHFWKGKLVGWQNRWLDDDRPGFVMKYTNTSDFPKKETLFNYENCLNTQEPITVVESVPTVLTLESLGLPAVATFGDQTKETQLKLLRVFQQGVRIAPDNDKGGINLRDTVTKYLEDYIPVWHVPMVAGEKSDLADLAHDPDKLYAQVAQARRSTSRILDGL